MRRVKRARSQVNAEALDDCSDCCGGGVVRLLVVCRRSWIALGVLLGACTRAAPLPPVETEASALLALVDKQLAFGPRVPNTLAHRQTADWITAQVRASAEVVDVDTWRHVTARGDTLELRNMLARFNPAARERVLYVAHWDSRPRADAKSSTDTTAPVLGANDGASGVAVLLGVARALKRQPPVELGVDLLFVDGEDWGSFQDTTETLLGARRYATQHRGAAPPRAVIVWDMVGDRELVLAPEGNSLLGAPALVEHVWSLAERLGYATTFVRTPREAIIDDHLPLQAIGWPAIDVIDLSYGPDNRWHHTPEDTRDKLSGASLQAVAHVATAFVRTLDRRS